jgi:hypothetical protein
MYLIGCGQQKIREDHATSLSRQLPCIRHVFYPQDKNADDFDSLGWRNPLPVLFVACGAGTREKVLKSIYEFQIGRSVYWMGSIAYLKTNRRLGLSVY